MIVCGSIFFPPTRRDRPDYVYTTGTTTSVKSVDVINPAITARAIGARPRLAHIRMLVDRQADGLGEK